MNSNNSTNNEYEVNNQLRFGVLNSMLDMYHSVHVIDLTDYSYVELKDSGYVGQFFIIGGNAVDQMKKVMYATMTDDYLQIGLDFTDVKTIGKRLKYKRSLYMDLHGRNVGWIRLSFIVLEINRDGEAKKVIVTTEVIDEQKKHELALVAENNIDGLTGLNNRRAYENDMMIYPDVPPEPGFTYAAIDINGLKVVNDTLGHAAGDELITGAAEVLSTTLGNYGKAYRIGGDEFVVMFFADEEHFEIVKNDLYAAMIDWSGSLVNSLSMSVGFATKREFPTSTVEEMAIIADKRMYEEKEHYYSRMHVDRRGQKEAYDTLIDSYTKILTVNLTDDTYTIIKTDPSELVYEKGFSNTFSEWMRDFAGTGQVHADDVERYLRKTDVNVFRKHFKEVKGIDYAIHYRRKLGDDYENVVMELTPTKNYTDDNQTVFLFVKTSKHTSSDRDV